MATERLSMRQTREILRQKWRLGRTHREVAQSLGISCGAVGTTVLRARAAGLPWAQVEALDDEALHARVYGPPTPQKSTSPVSSAAAAVDSLPDLDTSGLCLVKTLSTALTCWPYRNGTRRSGTAPEHPRALRRSPKGGRPRYTAGPRRRGKPKHSHRGHPVPGP